MKEIEFIWDENKNIANQEKHGVSDGESIGLDDLRKRIEASDLVPSRASLTDNIRENMQALQKQGITTLASLRKELKTSKRVAVVAEATGIFSSQT